MSAPLSAWPLPFWRNGIVKGTILDFVAQVTSEHSPTCAPPADRITTFDNDCTLWGEYPMYVQAFFLAPLI